MFANSRAFGQDAKEFLAPTARQTKPLTSWAQKSRQIWEQGNLLAEGEGFARYQAYQLF
jgi:hypothetical protein